MNTFILTALVGIASWYGEELAGRPTASGEAFDPGALTAACWFFPLGSVVEVREPVSGRSVVVRINDRGPALRLTQGRRRRIIDLSEAAFAAIADVERGLVRVRVKVISTTENTESTKGEL